MAGYDIIDKVKASLENLCPATVSCADIIALVARDAVSQQFGKDLWEVFTGRKDGNTSIAKEALDNLPSPAATFEDLAASFHEKGLNKMDLDILSGAHTIGMAPCSTIATRLMPVTDPTLDQGFAESLKELCNRGQNNVSFGTPRFDNQYYSQLLAHRGVLRSDASLLEDTESLHLVGLLSRGEDTFLKNFGAAMQKMGGIGVLVGSDGGVRTNCIGVQLLS
ncbi:hypothetical protein MKW98_019982 [Papaver atlanticum]|uniref:Plant heme peroxidase family profile domain-containing protein n=1 Tax=Papaver atlanticum TaxID=357466 RepID=A0AAD4S109_9MAGN|nr:hypothetical protein MKW98_019982 [Papaver atlanticum]